MSSWYVRNMAEQWVQGLATPYYNTINIEQNPSDPQWLTLDFIVFDTRKETFCEDKEETGSIRLLFLGNPGVGFDELFVAAESDAAVFYSNVDGTGALTLELLNSPMEFGNKDTPYFGVEISIDYSYRP